MKVEAPKSLEDLRCILKNKDSWNGMPRLKKKGAPVDWANMPKFSDTLPSTLTGSVISYDADSLLVCNWLKDKKRFDTDELDIIKISNSGMLGFYDSPPKKKVA